MWRHFDFYPSTHGIALPFHPSTHRIAFPVHPSTHRITLPVHPSTYRIEIFLETQFIAVQGVRFDSWYCFLDFRYDSVRKSSLRSGPLLTVKPRKLMKMLISTFVQVKNWRESNKMSRIIYFLDFQLQKHPFFRLYFLSFEQNWHLN